VDKLNTLEYDDPKEIGVFTYDDREDSHIDTLRTLILVIVNEPIETDVADVVVKIDARINAIVSSLREELNTLEGQIGVTVLTRDVLWKGDADSAQYQAEQHYIDQRKERVAAISSLLDVIYAYRRRQ
jgi:hypothetical protein